MPKVSSEWLTEIAGLSISEVIARVVDRWGDRPYLHSTEGFVTFKEMGDEVQHWRRVLAGHGMNAGDHVVLFSDNSYSWCTAFLGIIAGGGVVVPLDTHMRGEHLINLIRSSNARIIMMSEALRHAVEEVLPDLAQVGPLVIIDNGRDDTGRVAVEDDRPSLAAIERQNPDDVCALMFTAGTTGDAKRVPLTHRNLLSGVAMALELIGARHSDIVLNPLPLYHVFPLVDGFLATFCGGMGLALARRIDRGELYHLVMSMPVTIVMCVPALYRFLADRLKKDVAEMKGMRGMIGRWMLRQRFLRSSPMAWRRFKSFMTRSAAGTWNKVRLFVSGGAELDHDAMESLNAMGFPLMEGYGLTETSAAVSFNHPGAYRCCSVGRPDPRWVQVRIDRPDRQGVGEILLRGPMVMAGYRDQPHEHHFTEDGYFRTGDIGFVDRKGFLHITARQKDVIVPASGKNIYPVELELHYARSPLIGDICIFGLPYRGRKGESIHAVVIVSDKLHVKSEEEAYEWIAVEIDRLSRELPAAKRVRSFNIWRGDFPRASTGKLKKFEIRKQVLAHAGAGAEPVVMVMDELLMNREEAHFICDVLHELLPQGADLFPSTSLDADLKLDRERVAMLKQRMERKFNCIIPAEGMATARTVKDVIILLNRRMRDGRYRRGTPAIN